jgi:hypothetical protein
MTGTTRLLSSNDSELNVIKANKILHRIQERCLVKFISGKVVTSSLDLIPDHG